jgi:hypothetical protein
MASELGKDDWKYISVATLFAGMAYVFMDVARSGVVDLYSVGAYVAVFITVMVVGRILVSRRNE